MPSASGRRSSKRRPSGWCGEATLQRMSFRGALSRPGGVDAPTHPARLTDLHRLKAWPFVSWCFVQRHLVPDVELLLAKPGGCGLPVEWAEHEPDNLAAVAEAAAVLGWSASWQRQVGLLAASTISACTWESASAS